MISFQIVCALTRPSQNDTAIVPNVIISLFLSPLDEEKVGPWPRGPIFPFRKKALQRPGVSKVKQPALDAPLPLSLSLCMNHFGVKGFLIEIAS